MQRAGAVAVKGEVRAGADPIQRHEDAVRAGRALSQVDYDLGVVTNSPKAAGLVPEAWWRRRSIRREHCRRGQQLHTSEMSDSLKSTLQARVSTAAVRLRGQLARPPAADMAIVPLDMAIVPLDHLDGGGAAAAHDGPLERRERLPLGRRLRVERGRRGQQ